MDPMHEKPMLIEEPELGKESKKTHINVNTNVALGDAIAPQFEVGESSKKPCKDSKEHSNSRLQEVLVQCSIGVPNNFIEAKEGEVVEQFYPITGNSNEKSKSKFSIPFRYRPYRPVFALSIFMPILI